MKLSVIVEINIKWFQNAFSVMREKREPVKSQF